MTLRRDDLHLFQLYAVVREKGDRSRAVPFTSYTAQLLRRWLDIRPIDANPETVFCSLGSNTTGDPLTLSGLHMLIRRLRLRTGVTGRTNPHAFRHSFARQYLLNGGDLATLAQLMGHSDVSVTTDFYAIYTEAELAKQHGRFSPIRNLKRGQNE